MFTGLSMMCLIPCVIFAEQNHADAYGRFEHNNNRVAIHLDGEIAREYVRLLRSQRVADAFLKDGSVIIEGRAYTIDDGWVRIHHVAFISVVGKPVRSLRLESTIDGNLIKHQQTANPNIVGNDASYRVELTHLRSAELRSSVLVGDFPESGSYR